MKKLLFVMLSVIPLSLLAQPNHAQSTQENIIEVSVIDAKPLIPNQENQITIKLTDKRHHRPITLADLATVHTEKIHLLIIDPSLNDYHHKHPKPTNNPGEYVFQITPRTVHNYRVWVDIVPTHSGIQQYNIIDLPGTKSCAPPCQQPIEQRVSTDLHLRSEFITTAHKLQVGKPALAKINITTLNGEPFTNLEPIMGAFAHLVGFYDDYTTIAHIHPMGAKPNSEQDRAGPTIEFHLMPEKVGYIRLVNQIQVNEENHFSMFGLHVVE
jgi:hypothetical protein